MQAAGHVEEAYLTQDFFLPFERVFFGFSISFSLLLLVSSRRGPVLVSFFAYSGDGTAMTQKSGQRRRRGACSCLNAF